MNHFNNKDQKNLWVWSHGRWYTIHMIGLLFNAEPNEFNKWFKGQLIFIECDDCRKHATEYYINNPISSNSFEWTVKFHNAVNKRLSYPFMTYKSAYKLYYNTKIDNVTIVDGLWKSLFSTAVNVRDESTLKIYNRVLDYMISKYPIEDDRILLSKYHKSIPSILYADKLIHIIKLKKTLFVDDKESYMDYISLWRYDYVGKIKQCDQCKL